MRIGGESREEGEIAYKHQCKAEIKILLWVSKNR
jgi:hypothetical protein